LEYQQKKEQAFFNSLPIFITILLKRSSVKEELLCYQMTLYYPFECFLRRFFTKKRQKERNKESFSVVLE
jgi:hypothetical protein